MLLKHCKSMAHFAVAGSPHAELPDVTRWVGLASTTFPIDRERRGAAPDPGIFWEQSAAFGFAQIPGATSNTKNPGAMAGEIREI